MKISKITSAIILSSLISTTGSALAASDNYYNNYYEDEGALLFKIRGFYLNSSSKLKNLPASNVGSTSERPKTLAQTGYGIDAATTYFFNDNIAAELSLGVAMIKVKSSTLSKASNSFGNGTGKPGKNNQILSVPAAGTIQYHVAPFGAIRPYFGGGIHGTYMYTRSKSYNVASGFGPVLQLGADFISKDDTLLTFDVRQYFLKSNVTFKQALLGSADVRSKVIWNPLVISLGFGFKL